MSVNKNNIENIKYNLMHNKNNVDYRDAILLKLIELSKQINDINSIKIDLTTTGNNYDNVKTNIINGITDKTFQSLISELTKFLEKNQSSKGHIYDNVLNIAKKIDTINDLLVKNKTISKKNIISTSDDTFLSDTVKYFKAPFSSYNIHDGIVIGICNPVNNDRKILKMQDIKNVTTIPVNIYNYDTDKTSNNYIMFMEPNGIFYDGHSQYYIKDVDDNGLLTFEYTYGNNTNLIGNLNPFKGGKSKSKKSKSRKTRKSRK